MRTDTELQSPTPLSGARIPAGISCSLACTLALFLAGCSSAPAKTAGAATPAPAQRAATAASVADDSFTASGPLVVENQLDVTSQRDGIVSSLSVDVGVNVRKGETIATLDDRQVAAQYESLAAKARSIEADVKNWEAETKIAETDQVRADEMWKAQLITKQDVEHARYKAIASRYEVERERENLKNAVAAAEAAQQELNKTRIVAPFDGVVARRYVRIGQHVAKDDKLFWISATGPMQVRFMLPERLMGKVKAGSSVQVTSALDADIKHAARIVNISPIVDPASGTLEAVAQLEGSVQDLHPGMTANVKIAGH